MEQLLAINTSLQEDGSGVEETKETKLDKPCPAVISTNMSSVCEEHVQEATFAFPLVSLVLNVVDYIDEVSVFEYSPPKTLDTAQSSP